LRKRNRREIKIRVKGKVKRSAVEGVTVLVSNRI